MKNNYTPEQINKYINNFILIYNEKGEEINPIPIDKECTVYCEYNNDYGFITNVTLETIGFEALIAKSWITEDNLKLLIEKQ